MHSAIIVGSTSRNISSLVQNAIDVLASKYDYVYISEAFKIQNNYTNVIMVKGKGNIVCRINTQIAHGSIQNDPFGSLFDIVVLPYHGSLTKADVISLIVYANCGNIISINNALDFDLNPRVSDCLLSNLDQVLVSRLTKRERPVELSEDIND